MALDAEVGGIAANSYVTLAEAESYFETSLFLERWNALSSKEAALVSSTLVIDSLTMRGQVATDTQALQVPRIGFCDRNGTEVDSAIIPIEFKYATYDLALYIGENPDALTSNSGITRIRIDVLEIEQLPITLGDVSSLPSSVSRRLDPFLKTSQRQSTDNRIIVQ